MPEFVDAYGIPIVYDVYEADRPRAVVQLLHGVGEHAGRYAALIDALVAEANTVYADDHRGHGRTGLRQWAAITAGSGGSAPADTEPHETPSGPSRSSSARRTPTCRSSFSGTRGARSSRRCCWIGIRMPTTPSC